MADSTVVSTRKPAFASDSGTARYYDRRAPDYDDWYTGMGRYAASDRPGWDDEVEQLVGLVRALSPARTIDIACGTGFLTRYLSGTVVGLDQSDAMIRMTRSRLWSGPVLVGDALAVPVGDRTFDRVFTGHFYGHLPPGERRTFLAEVRRVAGELVVADSARRDGGPADDWQERELPDGSRHWIFKRYLGGDQLASEIGGQVLMAGRWFVAARVAWQDGVEMSAVGGA